MPSAEPMRRYSPKCLDAPAAGKRRLDKEWSKRICHNGDALVGQGWILDLPPPPPPTRTGARLYLLIQHHHYSSACTPMERYLSQS
jgi:hypothetical protein